MWRAALDRDDRQVRDRSPRWVQKFVLQIREVVTTLENDDRVVEHDSTQ
jgi:hypothetical protein